MPLPQTLNWNAAALQAGRILEAFASGNEPLLQQELHNSQGLGNATAPGLEQERWELLQALSEGMLRSGNRLSEGRRDPAVRRCLDLLAHLAHGPAANPNSSQVASSLLN